jgi:isopenicillin N synthase-like dioxygenase
MLDGHVQVVDLRDYLAGTPAQWERVTRQVADTCSRTGFFLLRGHGLDPALLARIRAVSSTFFDAPEPYKLAYHRPGTSRGYTPMGTESLGATGESVDAVPPDAKEAFAIGGMDVPERSAEFARSGLRPVAWPDHPPAFRRTLLDYYRAVRSLAAQVMVLLADALGVPSVFFASRLDRSVDFLRVINYPEQSIPPAAGALRAGAHTDFGALTILASDDAPGGLQIQGDDGAWIDIPHLPEALIVNIGDLMAYWTNHRWISALHRVVNPPTSAFGRSRRQSVVFFHNPNLDAVIEPPSSCVTSDELAPPPIIAGEWLRSKTFRQRVATRGNS